MKFKDIIGCGFQDLKVQKSKNRISFIMILLSIVTYIGVNSTVQGFINGANDMVSGHDTRVLFMCGEGDAKKEYDYIVNKYGEDERVQEIYLGMTYYTGMIWQDPLDFLGVYKQDMFFLSCYESLFNYGYKGEIRMPKNNEIILPRYMYNIGIYDEYTYANGDELIGQTLKFKNMAYYQNEDEYDEYELKVIGTYDNVTKKYAHNVVFINYDFMCELMHVSCDTMVDYYMDMGSDVMTDEDRIADMAVYMFIKEGNNINEVWQEMNTEVNEELNAMEGEDKILRLTFLDPEVEGFYYYVIAIGNIVSFVLLLLAIINIMISSVSEVKKREWEFALKMAMGYRRCDIIRIFAVEKILNVLKALVVSLVVLLMYTRAFTYYNKNMAEYWKRSFIIAIDFKDVLIAMVMIVIAALTGVVVARLVINNIKVAKTLKTGE